MKKYILAAISSAMLATVGFAAADPAGQSQQTYMQFAQQNPMYFHLGLGVFVPVGDVSSFNGDAFAPGSNIPTKTAINMQSGVDFEAAFGYRLPSLPMHLELAAAAMFSDIDTKPKVTGEAAFNQSLIMGNAYYDYAITPHWVASIGAGIGLLNMYFTQDSGNVHLQGENNYGFAYQGIAKVAYRFTNWSLGLSQRFYGSTLAVNKFYKSADKSGTVMGTLTNIEVAYNY